MDRFVPRALLAGCLLLAPVGGLAAEGEPALGPERSTCSGYHREKRFREAAECYRARQQAGDTDPELYRLLGAVCALQGDRARAYHYYQTYLERCPNCMYAPMVHNAIRGYDASLDPKGEADVEDEKGRGGDESKSTSGDKSRVRATREGLARALLDKAEALERLDPEEAKALANRAVTLVEPDHALAVRARTLLARLKVGSAAPPPKP